MIPAGVRERRNLEEGSVLVLVESDDGLPLLDREQLHAQVATDLVRADLVGELFADRRREAGRERDELERVRPIR